MKKTIIKLLILISIVIAITCTLLLLNNNNSKSKARQNISKSPDLLAINSYSNYAWGYSFSGTAIFSDGSIYTWKENDSSDVENYDLQTTKGLEEYILKEGKLKNKKVSDKDLKEIKKHINKVDDDINIKHPGADIGTYSITIINKNNKQITLKCSGDSTGENQTENSQKLLKIIEKYS